MFSGIVEEVATVAYVGPRADQPEGVELRVRTGIAGDGTKVGDSITVGGVCLTVTSLDADGISAGLSLETLRRTVRSNVLSLLIEGGSGVLGSFVDARLVDKDQVFVAPLIIGGAEARSPIGGRGVDRVSQAARLCTDLVESLDGDLLLTCYPDTA